MGLFNALRFPTFISIFSFNLVQLGMASAERILCVIKTETDLDENLRRHHQADRGQVVFENVSFGYDGEPRAQEGELRRPSPGETVAIVGQTGSGKTTLTRLINRIFDADEWPVLVDGVDVRDWSLEALRSQISTIEQDVFLFSRSHGRDNIAFGARGHPGGGSKRPPARPRPTSSSRASPTATTPRWASGGDPLRRATPAHRHRPGLSDRPAHPDPGRLAPAPSTAPPRTRSRRPCGASAAAAPPSSSPTA